MSSPEIIARYHRAILDASADALAELYAPDAVHEFPFAPPGAPRCYRGREEIREGYRAAWAASPAKPTGIHDIAVHRSADGEVLTVEQTVVGTHTGTGRPFAFPGVLVMRIRDGLIVHNRDYLDGLGIADALGRAPLSR